MILQILHFENKILTDLVFMVEEVSLKMIKYFSGDVKRINHALKVFGFAGCIARKEKLTDDEILKIEMTAILHDIGIVESEKKYNSSSGHYQEIEGPPVVRELLSDTEIDSEMLDRICYIIGNHHSYQKIDGVDFQIIVEADFLVNIFEDEISESAVNSIREKYFKTASGIEILESVYM